MGATRSSGTRTTDAIVRPSVSVSAASPPGTWGGGAVDLGGAAVTAGDLAAPGAPGAPQPPPREVSEVRLDEITLGHMLGRGAYGTVHYGEWHAR